MRLIMLVTIGLLAHGARANVLDPPDTGPGYLALILVNETPFPGERGWVSEADTKAATPGRARRGGSPGCSSTPRGWRRAIRGTAPPAPTATRPSTA